MKHFLPLVSRFLFLLLVLTSCVPAAAIATQATMDVGVQSPTPPSAIPVTGPTPTAVVIQHQVVPHELPSQRINHTGDYDSSLTADQRRAPAGDRFVLGQFERPFNADTMAVYYPDLDIQEGSIFQDDIWFVATIKVKGRDPNDSFPGTYALELDQDLDGRGDLLILAKQPSTNEWTSIGVQIWAYENNDVGGLLPMKADLNTEGDGFETPIFDQGQGHNADLAWVSISAADPNMIRIAFMQLLLASDRSYLVGLWAGYDDLRPSLFDFNDHFTQEQAGEAMAQLDRFYPIKEISGLDNTCRMAIGFEPTGLEPGIC